MQTLASVGIDSHREDITIRIWDVGTWRRKATIVESMDTFPDYCGDIAFSSDGKIMSLAEDDEVFIWDVTPCSDGRILGLMKYSVIPFSCDNVLLAAEIW